MPSGDLPEDHFERAGDRHSQDRADHAHETAARAKAYLVKHGVNVAGEQQTKTRTALNFFARELKKREFSG